MLSSKFAKIIMMYNPKKNARNPHKNPPDITNMLYESKKTLFDVPLAMVEPYACKKPVIASDLELFKEFSNDRTASSGSIERFARTLVFILPPSLYLWHKSTDL